MPTVPSTPISQEPALSPVLLTDRFIGLRTPQNQADPTKRLGPVSLTDAATALRPLLNLNTNNIPGTDKRVRFQTAAQLAAAPDGGDCLDGLNPASLVLGSLAWVEFHPLGYGTTLRLLYDGATRTPAGSGLIAFRTGDAVAGDTVPVRWVVASGPEVGVTAYPQRPAGYVFALNELVRAYVSDVPTEQFFAANAATALPAPTVSAGDANWRAVSPASLPAAVAPLYSSPGTATNGPMTQAATTSAFTQLQALVAVIRPDGTTLYLNRWPADNTEAPAGSQIRIRGNFGVAGALYVTPSFNSLFLEAGAVFSCDRLCPQSVDPAPNPSRMVISGSGTLRGNIIFYGTGQVSKILIQGIRHEGMLINENVTVNGLMADVKLSQVSCVPPVGMPYLYTLSRSGISGGCLYFRYRFYQCRIEVAGTSGASSAYVNARANTVASAFMLGAFNYTANAAQDAADQANCLLEVTGCSLYGDGTSGNAVLATYGGFATYRFAYNTAYGITTPTVASDPALILWPATGPAPTATAPTVAAASFTAS